MKQQVATSLAGLMLLTAGCENAGGKLATVQNGKSSKVTPQDVGEKNFNDQCQGKSAPTLHNGGLYVRGDFLYWRADEVGLEYAVTSNFNLQPPSSKGTTQSPKTKWNPGFRVGLGYTFAGHDYWELGALWTHYQTERTASKVADLNFNQNSTISSLVPWWGASVLGTLADRASVKWNLHYNVYDLDLGRNYFVSKTVSVHPFMGVRGSTIHQQYHSKYRAVLTQNQISFVNTSFKGTNDFWGIGAHLGSGLQWRMTSSFSILGNVGGSLLYGDFNVQQKYQALIPIGSPATSAIPVQFNDHITTGAFNIEAMVGFQWERFFYNNKYRLAIAAGYEWSEWFAQNRFSKFDLIANSGGGNGSNIFTQVNGDLTLQGANLQVRWDF